MALPRREVIETSQKKLKGAASRIFILKGVGYLKGRIGVKYKKVGYLKGGYLKYIGFTFLRVHTV